MKSLLEVLQGAAEYLGRHGASAPRPEAELLLAHVLHLPRLQLYLQFDRPLDEAQLASVRPLLRRRAGGEPLQYILGTAAFYDLELEVGPGVLVPRPETERLVDLARSAFAGQTTPVLDLCTGSGAIVLTLAGHLPECPALVGVDLSPEALAYARRNAQRLGRTRVDFRLGDLFAPVAGERFGLITANPPYVATGEMATLPVDVREHEPHLALEAGADGLDVLRRLAAAGRHYLLPNGLLLSEIGASQGAAGRELFAAAGWRDVVVHQDYNRRDRVLAARA